MNGIGEPGNWQEGLEKLGAVQTGRNISVEEVFMTGFRVGLRRHGLQRRT